MDVNQRFFAQMSEATRILQTSGPVAATAAIQRALQGASARTPAARKTNADGPERLLEPHLLVDMNPATADRAHTESESATDILGQLRKSSWRKAKGPS